LIVDSINLFDSVYFIADWNLMLVHCFAFSPASP